MYFDSISICLLLLFSAVKGYPLKRDNLNNKIECQNEKQYPNGTVVGQYMYKDKEGNPVEVKYFADGSSYGVELNSAKVIHSNDKNAIQYKPLKFNNIMSTVGMFEPKDEPTVITAKGLFIKEFKKNKTYNPFDIPNYYPNKVNRYKESNKVNDDYEIFLENDFKPTSQCDKEKVKVYLDKNKRKTPNSAYLYRPPESDYCERF